LIAKRGMVKRGKSSLIIGTSGGKMNEQYGASGIEHKILVHYRQVLWIPRSDTLENTCKFCAPAASIVTKHEYCCRWL
jgi:hypothetical protein